MKPYTDHCWQRLPSGLCQKTNLPCPHEGNPWHVITCAAGNSLTFTYGPEAPGGKPYIGGRDMKESHKTWSCPFFVWDERLAVHCEGGRPRFPDYEAADKYTGDYCAGGQGWKDCTLAKNLMAYYQRTEDNDT